MSDISEKTVQPARNDTMPKALSWLPASILAGVTGGSVAFLILNTEIIVEVAAGLGAILLGAPLRDGFNLLLIQLSGSMAGAVGGAVSGLIYYSTRRKPLIRAIKWSIAWTVISLLGTILIMFAVGWTRHLWLSISGYDLHPAVAFLILSAIFGVLTAWGFYLLDPYGEEFG